ncbi:MAG: hypothetical protein H8E73_00195 [Planctomycetes bacterium]|nr:hypothetical protein [Planctomycetota bacterium]
MPDKYHALRIAVVAALLPAIAAAKVDSAGAAVTEQTLEAIRDCMAQSPAPWPDEWKWEYIDTIRSAVESHRDASHYVGRLEILRRGFADCWEGLTKNKDRPLFEVYRCRTRWYVEHLMGTQFPSEDERQKLHDQYTDIWDHAVASLLAQFLFLDPNAVQAAKADDLSICYRKIDAPLMPVYLRPMSAEQVGQIKQRWDKLRYDRVDLWRRMSSRSSTPGGNGDAPSPNAKRDYDLTKESLSQLLGLVWMVVPQRPDYYLAAMDNQIKALKRRVQVKRQARSDQQRLEKTRSRQLLQTEHISFLLAALLETPQCLEGVPPVVTQEKNPLEQQDKPARGGDAYEVDNRSREK